MRAFVVIATKGRAKETEILLDYLSQQTLEPGHIFIVGSEEKDIAGLAEHPLVAQQRVELLITSAGSCHQRNVGLDSLQPYIADLAEEDWFVTFFDDDFRPAPTWLAIAAKYMQQSSELIGVTGHVLADGVGSEFGFSEQDAKDYISGAKPCEQHWSNTPEPQKFDGLYGCNMAIRGNAANHTRFDENLPLYGWQEDYDYANRASSKGDLYLMPDCKGVHLGTSSGRTSGVRFGYSQIANPIYLAKKGSMPWAVARKMMAKNIAANIFKTLTRVKIKDYPGRLKGNIRAIIHLILWKLNPQRVLDI